MCTGWCHFMPIWFPHHVHKLLDFWVCIQGVSLRLLSCLLFEQSETECLPEAVCSTFFLTCNSVGTNMYSLLLFTCWLTEQASADSWCHFMPICFPHHVYKLLDFWVCIQGVSLRLLSCLLFEQSETGCLPEAICSTFFLTCNSVGTSMYSLLLFTCGLTEQASADVY